MLPTSKASEPAAPHLNLPAANRNHAKTSAEAADGVPKESGDVVLLDGHTYLRIEDVDRMPPFLMSVVSDTDFWLFVGSNGGFTAGRIDPDHAIFPYRTADKILAQPGSCGVMSIFLINGETWEPWNTSNGHQDISRNLYKHITGAGVVFEEIHHGLGLAFRWELSVSQRHGLLRHCSLRNFGNEDRTITLLDGWHHLLPAGVSQETYARYSYLASAYMRHEAATGSALGIYTLNSGITDRAEPSESLRAACAWSHGLDGAALLLSDRQVDSFRRGIAPFPEHEVRGNFGAHLLSTTIQLPAGESREWVLAADTGLDHTDVMRLRDRLASPTGLMDELATDKARGISDLRKRIAGAGAIQHSADPRAGIHHFANVLFNCMRGGTLDDNDRFPRSDFREFLETRNREVLAAHEDWLGSLPDPCTLTELNKRAARSGDPQLERLAGEYLPLCFSRRHGDPSRPWNRFEIRTKTADGRPVFTYAGNWRDIFQNWESLAMSYPGCFEPMIHIFLNASTADGYNPYRITRAGIDWEVLDPDDPWSHIGYWGDHQIVYLLRLLEGLERFQPGRLSARLDRRVHSHANVPYEIRGFDDLLRDPKHTIAFNEDLHRQTLERAAILGGDGKLLATRDGVVALVSLAEKLLIPLLVKLTNLVPGGGIWLNTQRPEWNDANNALAGWGLSVVTVCHMRRYVRFLADVFDDRSPGALDLSEPVAELMRGLVPALENAASAGITDESRFEILSALGSCGEIHRRHVYARRPAETTRVESSEIRSFLTRALAAIDLTVRSNLREDGLFHSYNLLETDGRSAHVRHLDLMLEGQVAVLGSGALTASEALALLDGLRASSLFREDQHSYLLYPDRTIQSFLERNTLPAGWEKQIPRLAAAVREGDRELIRTDDAGGAHFHPDLTNAKDLEARLDLLAGRHGFKAAVPAERAAVLGLWETVFQHKSFTGRSGTMFGFEGLGSIYWHMVAKLLLSVQEVHDQAAAGSPDSDEARRLAAAYDEVRKGLGFTKTSRVYGAFPTDPYSHTPRHLGAQQPGMTGQVKEEILTRMGELGVVVNEGTVRFRPVLLKTGEFFRNARGFTYIDIDGGEIRRELPPGALAFTAFQVPVIYQLSDREGIVLEHRDGNSTRFPHNILPAEESRRLFQRDGSIRAIIVRIPADSLTPEPIS